MRVKRNEGKRNELEIKMLEKGPRGSASKNLTVV